MPDWLQGEDNARANREEHLRKGITALMRGDYAETAAQLEQAIGSDSWVRFWLGKAYYGLGRYDQAIKISMRYSMLQELRGRQEPVPFCHYARGLAYARLGMLDPAKADLQACLPAMIETLRVPSGGLMFEYADNPLSATASTSRAKRKSLSR